MDRPPDTTYARACHYVLGCGCLILCLIVTVLVACVVNDFELKRVNP